MIPVRAVVARNISYAVASNLQMLNLACLFSLELAPQEWAFALATAKQGQQQKKIKLPLPLTEAKGAWLFYHDALDDEEAQPRPLPVRRLGVLCAWEPDPLFSDRF